MASKEAEESENSSVSIGEKWDGFPFSERGFYRCLRAIGGSSFIHVGLVVLASSKGGAQRAVRRTPGAARDARRMKRAARACLGAARGLPGAARSLLCVAGRRGVLRARFP